MKRPELTPHFTVTRRRSRRASRVHSHRHAQRRGKFAADGDAGSDILAFAE